MGERRPLILHCEDANARWNPVGDGESVMKAGEERVHFSNCAVGRIKDLNSKTDPLGNVGTKWTKQQAVQWDADYKRGKLQVTMQSSSAEVTMMESQNRKRAPAWTERENVLELAIFDEDVVQDDGHLIVFFDIAKIPLGETIFMKFQLNPQCACMSCRAGRSRTGPLTVPLNLLPFDQEVIDKHRKFDLHFKTKQCREDLDMRLGFELCVEEQDFLCKRKKYVAAALKKVLQLEEDLQDDEVPVVAFMTTGGGTRALTAMYAHLLSIQKLNVLDCISYISGLSGTTWTMSNLYEDPDWSQKDMEASVSDARKHVIKNKFLACFSVDRLKYYVKELHQRKQEGHKIGFTDLWGLIIEAMLHDGEDHHKLTDQQQALSHGQNPLPIYLVLNVKDKISNRDFREWMEFTPYEVGLLKYGAFIRAENFGSEFFMGRLMKKLPESRICFLEGIWSSVFSLNLMDAWYVSFESEEFWHKWTQDRVIDIDEETVLPTRPSELNTRVVSPPDSLSTVFRDVFMLRPAVSEIHNFLKGCQMHNNYLENEFSRWKGEEEAKSPKECYIVGDKEGPETPVVLLFPLVNDTFRNYKAPGVKRSPSEMAEGEIDVADINGSYNINNLRYSEEDFDKLAKLSYYNVQNNKDLILQALRIAVERKKQHRNSLKSHTPL
ncbi:Cytosolic phospholipase A2 epsilon [Chelonia mydas]|uniref:Cytosolic phospholipase A2 epsilon n=1 Tax=Chelonia mydas TaxID=8469 RepID=M7BNV4_CHEMY|nr:Cytosolic phospholipase A2 epsilon [Chelonia mydas]